MQANYVQRLRIVFGKDGPMRYVGHLDMVRSIERALNRAQIPLAYTQGYNRRPRLQFASALPLGYISQSEIADMWLKNWVDPAEAQDRINDKMAPGLTIVATTNMELKAPPLQNITRAATYQVEYPETTDDQVLSQAVRRLLEAESILRTRKGKVYDLRPLVLELEFGFGDSHLKTMRMKLLHAPGNVGRPDEVLLEIGIDPMKTLIKRTEIFIDDLGSGA